MSLFDDIYRFHMSEAKTMTPAQVAAIDLQEFVGEHLIANTCGYPVTLSYRPGEVCEHILWINREFGFVIDADTHRRILARAGAAEPLPPERWAEIEAAIATGRWEALEAVHIEHDRKYLQ